MRVSRMIRLDSLAPTHTLPPSSSYIYTDNRQHSLYYHDIMAPVSPSPPRPRNVMQKCTGFWETVMSGSVFLLVSLCVGAAAAAAAQAIKENEFGFIFKQIFIRVCGVRTDLCLSLWITMKQTLKEKFDFWTFRHQARFILGKPPLSSASSGLFFPSNLSLFLSSNAWTMASSLALASCRSASKCSCYSTKFVSYKLSGHTFDGVQIVPQEVPLSPEALQFLDPVVAGLSSSLLHFPENINCFFVSYLFPLPCSSPSSSSP